MIVTVITLCYNEARFVPFFLAHWLPIADRIVCFDGMSTDGTRELLAACPLVTIVDHDTGGMVDDGSNMEIKSTAYQWMQSDWFFVVDFDEFPYHISGVRAILAQYDALGVTVAPPCEGWNMIADSFPDPTRPLTEQVAMGVRGEAFDKVVAFKSCVEIQYGAGAHNCQLSGVVVQCPDAPRMKLLHYKWLGEEYVRDKAARTRISPRNREMRWGFTLDGREQRDVLVDYWRDQIQHRAPVI